MRIALYARVSTQDQHPEAQLQPLREYAQRRGAEAVEFVDHGVSGRKDRRDGLDGLMAAVQLREVDAVAVTKLDRRGRHPGRPKTLDARQAARAQRMAGAGRSVREVAGVLGCSPNTAHRAIRGRR